MWSTAHKDLSNHKDPERAMMTFLRFVRLLLVVIIIVGMLRHSTNNIFEFGVFNFIIG